MEVYKRVYIKTADDLPKEHGIYLTEFGWLQFNGKWKYPQRANVTYTRGIDWWLEPVEIPTKDDANDFAAKIDISGSEYRGFQKCYNWLLSRLK